MNAAGRVAVTGASGRLGRAVVDALEGAGIEARPWSRPDYDLDDPTAAARLIERDRPETVIHCAAWTDVDGCSREPELARRRNRTSVGELAEACVNGGARLLLASTNEVFDGRRIDGRGYVETDPVGPINAYGSSKLAGEEAARRAFAEADLAHWIVRTAWLYGPPGNDFPAKILAAADRLPAGEALRVVADEVGSPTFTRDLATAIVQVTRTAPAGTYHLVNGGHASRADWAERILDRCAIRRPVSRIRQQDFVRPSRPPAWAVLDASKAAEHGITLRSWEVASDDYLAALCADR